MSPLEALWNSTTLLITDVFDDPHPKEFEEHGRYTLGYRISGAEHFTKPYSAEISGGNAVTLRVDSGRRGRVEKPEPALRGGE